MKKYYIFDNNNKIGPIELESLSDYNLKPDTLVWHSELTDWKKASEIKELVPFLSPPDVIIGSNNNPPPIPNLNSSQAKSTITFNRKYLKFIFAFLAVVIVIYFIFSRNNSSSDDSKTNSPDTDYPIPTAPPEVNVEDEENKLKQEALTKKNMEYRNNWSSYITANRTDFSYSDLGGISDLNIDVTNSTEYVIDELGVVVEYVKANGSIFKTESLYFSNLKPKSKQRLPAPDSERGIDVNYFISYIYAKKFKFCYEINSLGNGSIIDPWKCK